MNKLAFFALLFVSSFFVGCGTNNTQEEEVKEEAAPTFPLTGEIEKLDDKLSTFIG